MPARSACPAGQWIRARAARQAAIREFHEELGTEGHAIRLLGGLSPIYVNASNFRIEPWIGVTDSRPAMAPNPVRGPGAARNSPCPSAG